VRQSILAVMAVSAVMLAAPLRAPAADLETTPLPPAVEAPPPAAVAPPAVAVVPGPPCPVVRRCGYWGCGWRPVCAPVAGAYWGGPGWGFYGPNGGYRPYWGRGYHWGGGYRGYGGYRRGF
jgi:hypothetical protein